MSDVISVEEATTIIANAVLSALKSAQESGGFDAPEDIDLEKAAADALEELAGQIVEVILDLDHFDQPQKWECPAERLDVELTGQNKGPAKQFNVQLFANHPKLGRLQL